MIALHDLHHGIFTVSGRIHVTEVLIAFTDNGLPDECLRCVDLRNGILIICIVDHIPLRCVIACISILQDSADMALDGIGVNRGIQVIGIVFPEIFTLAGELVTCILTHAGLDTIKDLSGIGIHAAGGKRLGIGRCPAAHQIQLAVAPAISIAAATGVFHLIYLTDFFSRIHRNNAGKQAEDHDEYHQERSCSFRSCHRISSNQFIDKRKSTVHFQHDAWQKMILFYAYAM